MVRDPPALQAWQIANYSRPLLVLVEGINDVEFLTRISRRLAMADSAVPDLSRSISAGRVLILPIGGGNLSIWETLLAPLQCREFHLYDRELEPETTVRLQTVQRINARPGCRATLTGKRSLDNYLHPQAVVTAGGCMIELGDEDCVGTLLAQTWYERSQRSLSWAELPRVKRRRLMHQAKRWLNTVAVEQMTRELLDQRDPAGELLTWLQQIAEWAG